MTMHRYNNFFTIIYFFMTILPIHAYNNTLLRDFPSYDIIMCTFENNYNSDIISDDSQFMNNLENDIAELLNIQQRQVFTIGVYEHEGKSVSDFVIFSQKKEVSSDLYSKFMDNAEGVTLTNTRYIPNICIKHNDVEDNKSRWQKMKEYANKKWDKFKNTELSAPEVSAWALGVGIPVLSSLIYCGWKFKLRKDRLRDQGIISVKLHTSKTIL